MEDKEYLDGEQVIKALEICTSTDKTKTEDCLLGCPFVDTNSCEKSLMCHALALIHFYKQKIFELENRLKECENGYEGTLYLDRCKLHDAEEKNKEFTEENATLHAAYTELTRTCMTLTQKVKVLNEQYDALLDRNVELGDEVVGLKAIAEQYQRQFEDCAEDRAKLIVEIQRLMELARTEMQTASQAITEVRADTVREIIATIKEKAESCGLYVANSHEPIDTIYQISKTLLDQIAQEMLEGKNEESSI